MTKIDDQSQDYSRLIAAQNESARRLKIKKITRILSEEHKKRNMFAAASGTCFIGFLVATHFAGIEINEAIQMEIQALGSFDALKEYLKMFTPAMWGTLFATATSFSEYMKHNKRYRKANDEFYDMIDTEPENYLDAVDEQAKSR